MSEHCILVGLTGIAVGLIARPCWRSVTRLSSRRPRLLSRQGVRRRALADKDTSRHEPN